MPFKVIQRYTSNLPKKSLTAPVSIAKSGKSSRIRINNEIAATLGWAVGQRVALAVGHGSDTGWLAIYPDARGYKIKSNGGSKTSIEITSNQILQAAPAFDATGTEHVIQDGVLYVATPAVVSEPKRKANGAHKAPTLSMVAAE